MGQIYYKEQTKVDGAAMRLIWIKNLKAVFSQTTLYIIK